MTLWVPRGVTRLVEVLIERHVTCLLPQILLYGRHDLLYLTLI